MAITEAVGTADTGPARGADAPPLGPPRGSGLEGWQAEESDDSERRGAFDIETESWDRFVVGGLITPEGDYVESSDEEAFFAEVLGQAQGSQIYAWNGGRFDFLWFLEKARAQGVRARVALAGTRVTRVQISEGPTLIDACALIPLPLKDAAAIAGIAITKETGLPCICSTSSSSRSSSPSARPYSCGGYCSISRTMSPRARRTLSRYLESDCRTALAIVRAVRAEGARSDYTLKGTIGGTAYATARRVCGFSDAEWEPDGYRFARSGYFGGRVECYRPRAASGFACDLNSAYPWALSVAPVPVGERISISGARAGRAFARGREGIYECTVEVPDMFIPPLPVRLGQRVVFPVGRLAGAWTRIEIVAALASGASVLRWGRALVWEDADVVCAPFMQQAWGRRAEAIATGNPGLKTWHKLVANSFTGKCAQQPGMESLLLNPKHVKLCPATPCRYASRERCARNNRSFKCCSHACRATCGAYKPLDRGGKLWSQSIWRIPDCGHVHWAAYLTAATRIELRAQLLADGDGGRTAVYCDTDSVYSSARRDRRLGAGLGEWGEEPAWTAWRCKAPKVYRFEVAEKTTAKAKGLSDITPAGWDDFEAGSPVISERGVKSLKTAAKGDSLFARKRLRRSSKADGTWYGGRRLKADGLTYPVTVEEFERGE